MSTALKLTITRIVLLVLIILFLLFPFDTAGISMPKLFINELLVVDIKYLIAGDLFPIQNFDFFGLALILTQLRRTSLFYFYISKYKSL